MGVDGQTATILPRAPASQAQPASPGSNWAAGGASGPALELELVPVLAITSLSVCIHTAATRSNT